MVCASAEELQARLAIRALWSPCREPAAGGPNNDDVAPPAMTFHRHRRAEVDEVLKAGLSRRLERLERQVNCILESGAKHAGQENGAHEAITNGASPTESATNGSAIADMSETEAQTDSTGEVVPINKVPLAFEKAFKHAITCTWPQQKKFQPSRRQKNYPDPPEKDEDIKKEAFVLRSTSQSLNQNLGSRERQIKSLKKQLEDVKQIRAEEEQKEAALDESLRLLQDDANVASVHGKRQLQLKQKHEQISKELERAKADAKRYEALAKQQHAFFMQADTIYCRGGVERIQRFVAGEVFLVPQPLPMDEEKVESWDVGTAIANPYEVDSWPFEANVLARRCPKECPMDGLPEETFEDLLEAQRPGRTNPFMSKLNLGRDRDDDDDDDDYGGPTATSRSA